MTGRTATVEEFTEAREDRGWRRTASPEIQRVLQLEVGDVVAFPCDPAQHRPHKRWGPRCNKVCSVHQAGRVHSRKFETTHFNGEILIRRAK